MGERGEVEEEIICCSHFSVGVLCQVFVFLCSTL